MLFAYRNMQRIDDAAFQNGMAEPAMTVFRFWSGRAMRVRARKFA